MLDLARINELAKEVVNKKETTNKRCMILKTYDNEILAENDVRVLQDNGIVCCLNGTEFRGVSGVGSISYLKNILDISLVVFEDDAQKASELLNLNTITLHREYPVKIKLTLKDFFFYLEITLIIVVFIANIKEIQLILNHYAR